MSPDYFKHTSTDYKTVKSRIKRFYIKLNIETLKNVEFMIKEEGSEPDLAIFAKSASYIVPAEN